MWQLFQKLLDRSILFSFDRTGYWRHLKALPKPHYVNGKEKKALITGASSGLGLEVAKQMSLEGWDLILPCRDPVKGEVAFKTFAQTPHIDLLNLSDIEMVKQYTPRGPIDVLIHNAGAMPHQKQYDSEGYEEIFSSQVFVPFFLTRKWIREGLLKKGARVIFVSSGGMYAQKLSLDDLEFNHHPYNKYRAYANAKRAQVILTEIFSQKYPELHFAAMHPGWAKTPGVKHSMRWFYTLLFPLLRTAKEGADTIHYLACVERWEKEGAFWFDRTPVEAHFNSKTKSSPSEKKALWDLCKQVESQWV